MNENKEKRMIADTGYEVKHAVHIGNYEVLVAENMREPEGNYYLAANYTDNGLICEYSQCMASSDYLEIMKEFTNRLNQQIEKVMYEFGKKDFQSEIITAEQCYPHDYGQSIDGKVVAIKAEVLRPECRRADRQLILVDGGFGANANAYGRAVYCYRLSDGKHTRFERHDVLGEIKELPEWAAERLATIKAEREAAKQPKSAAPETVGGYTITERIKVGTKLFVLGENPNAVQKYVTWQQIEGRSGYDLGHYYNDRDKAFADLHTRANKERTNTMSDKTKNRNDSR